MQLVTTRPEVPVSLPSISVDLLAASWKSESFPQDWSEDQRQRSLKRYERWLQLKLRHPKARLAPTRDIDMFWHLHMLSPVAYYRDCMRMFGRILDHDGGFGTGPGELPQLQAVFTSTAYLWEAAYGEAYREDGRFMCEAAEMTNCWHDCQDRCWHACAELS